MRDGKNIFCNSIKYSLKYTRFFILVKLVTSIISILLHPATLTQLQYYYNVIVRK